MKNCLTQGGLLFMLSVSLIFSSGCHSGSGDKTEDKVVFNQGAFNKQIQGVHEYLSPNQGFAAAFDNNFIFIFGDSDSTMVCQAGTYTTSWDTVIYTTHYASSQELIGSTIIWKAEFGSNDRLKAILFDDNRNITNEIYSVQKVKVDENSIRQLKKFEGSYKYVSGPGGGIILSGYMLYLTQSNGGAGTYKENNDTVTFVRLFCTNPDLIGAETSWINESMAGDTLNWAVISETGEVISRGKSLY